MKTIIKRIRRSRGWQWILLNELNMTKFLNMIEIEGIIMLKVLAASPKHTANFKLQIFVNTAWIHIIKYSRNKFNVIKHFRSWFKAKFNVRGVRPKVSPKPINRKIKYNRKHWLAIGINEYTNSPYNNLVNAVNDSISITQHAMQNLKFNSFRVLRDKEASKIAIECYIQKYLYNSLLEDDLLVISFHGHGDTKYINNQDYGFLVPYGAVDNTPSSLISMEILSLWTQLLPCRHILILLDCCFSGIMAVRSDVSKKTLRRNSIVQNLEKKCRIVINAGSHDQSVVDGGWGTNSIFTGLIISYPSYKQSLGSAHHLFHYLASEIPKKYNQNPTLGKLSGDQGGDLFLGI